LYSYVGTRLFNLTDKVSDLKRAFCELIGAPAGTDFLCFEEIKLSLIEALVENATLQASELGHGDIIIFQKSPPSDVAADASSLSTVVQYFDWFINRTEITFKPVYSDEDNKENMVVEFNLELSRKETYDSVNP
jgi:hypothetical protein